MSDESTLHRQLDLAELHSHLEALRGAPDSALPQALSRVRDALRAHANEQTLDIEDQWMQLEPALGLTGQQREMARLLREELADQAQPIGFAAVGGLVLLTSVAGGSAALEGGAHAPSDAGFAAVRQLDGVNGAPGGGDPAPSVAAANLAPEIADVAAQFPTLADAVSDLVGDPPASDEIGRAHV